jgi:hypothetical protein
MDFTMLNAIWEANFSIDILKYDSLVRKAHEHAKALALPPGIWHMGILMALSQSGRFIRPFMTS